MKKSEFTKIAKESDLTFKEAINLVAIKGEIYRNIKYEGFDNMCLNYDMPERQMNRIDSLEEKGFITVHNGSVKITQKALKFPLSIGANAFLGSFDDSDIIELIN